MRVLNILWLAALTAVFAPTTAANAKPAEPPATESAADTPAKAQDSERPTFTPMLRLTLRGEARVNAGDAPDPKVDTWRVLEGVRAGLRVGFKELTVVGQLQDVRAWGQGTLISTNPATGLHQGYIEVSGETGRQVSGFLRVGRQEIVYGSKRHFHSAPFNPASRAFDGVRGQLNVGRASIESGYMLVAAPNDFTVTADDGTETSVHSRGDHLAYSDIGYAFHEAVQLHAAVIVQRLGATASDPTRSRFFVMPGGRITGELAPGLKYEGEGWAQRGDERGRSLRAWMAAGSVTYEAQIPVRPGAQLHYEALSGSSCSGDPAVDEACTDGVHRDFDQLDGARHKYRGWMDLFAGSNLRDLAVSAFVSPSSKVKATAVYHFVQLQEASGRWFRLSGESAWGDGWDPTNTSNTLGHEVDLLIDYRPWKYLSIRPMYAAFFKGPAARQLLSPEPMHLVFLWFLAEF